MAYDIAADIRLDPRLKAILAGIPLEAGSDVDSREAMVAAANTEEARQQAELFRGFMDLCDTEESAPSAACGSTPSRSFPHPTATPSTSR